MTTWNCAKCNRSFAADQSAGCPYCGSAVQIGNGAAAILSEKAEMARNLANRHYEIETDLTRIFRYSGTAELEANPAEPVKLLEENAATIPTGVLPLQFGPVPTSGFNFPSVIIEVTPEEFRRIESHELKLPEGWDVREEYPKPEGN